VARVQAPTVPRLRPKKAKPVADDVVDDDDDGDAALHVEDD
jgi:hypothetical protein